MTDIPTLVMMALVAGIGAYLGGYLRQKGQNLATREDVTGITRSVERVRIQSETTLEVVRQEHRKGIAAIERRLDAHQMAYQHWHAIMRHVNGNALEQQLVACRDWWIRNWAYLDREPRAALMDACDRAERHSTLKASGDRDAMEENLRSIASVGSLIQDAVTLPAIADTMEVVSMGSSHPQLIPTRASAATRENGTTNE